VSQFTEAQVEEKVHEAVEKTERSFGATFKRLKSENEELRQQFESIHTEHESTRGDLEQRIGELESSLSESRKHISELAVRGEIQKQLREGGPLPEHFIEPDSIPYAEDPEELRTNVEAAIDLGRKEFEQALAEQGIKLPKTTAPGANPTNPPNRDTSTAQNMRNAEARDALSDMIRRGLIR